MGKIVYNADMMKLMSLFEMVTGAKVKDCFIDDNSMLTFVVHENEIGKAIGKKGVNVMKVERAINRKIKIVEFNSDPLRFLANLVSHLDIRDIKQEEGRITVFGADMKTRGQLIGKNSQNIINLKNILKRYFEVEELRVQ